MVGGRRLVAQAQSVKGSAGRLIDMPSDQGLVVGPVLRYRAPQWWSLKRTTAKEWDPVNQKQHKFQPSRQTAEKGMSKFGRFGVTCRIGDC